MEACALTFSFRPASTFNERHGLFVAFEGPPNSGKTVSGLRLARGIAGPEGRIAVLDTEGGRTLHHRQTFDFDVMMMDPPHRPERYAEAARSAEEAGYAALLIDSYSAEWRGVGGVIDWMDEELATAVERAKVKAASSGWQFDEDRARNANKSAASIAPKMAHKLMVQSFLARRIPIIFAIRCEETYDPQTKKPVLKAQMAKGFRYEVTVAFRLAPDRKGIIDLRDPETWKMEGAHRALFRDGDQLSEDHGAALAAWARGEAPAVPEPPAPKWKARMDAMLADVAAVEDGTALMRLIDTHRQARDWFRENRPEESATIEAAFAAAYQQHMAPAG